MKKKLKKEEPKTPTKKELGFKEYINIYVKSGTPIIMVDTLEVDRATATLKDIIGNLNVELPETKVDDYLKEEGYSFMVWDTIKGWRELLVNGDDNEDEDGEGRLVKNTSNPAQALNHIKDGDTKPGIFVMENFHLLWGVNKPKFIQLFRDIANHNKYNYKHLILVGNSSEVPIELKNIIQNLTFDLPTKNEIEIYIKDHCKNLTSKDSSKDIKQIAESATGMSINQIENALYVSAVTNQGEKIDRQLIFEQKAQIVQQSGLLEYVKSDENITTIGGLEALKEEVEDMSNIFNDFERAKNYGLKMPKGMLLVGLPGTGKTLTAKAIANILKVPLFRSDLGRVFGGIVGESESNVRHLTKLMSTLAPCVILWDEMEKMFSGMESSGRSDGGVTSRVTSDLLYWLQEKTEPVFVVGTINNIDMGLSGAHIRAGRWDSLRWLDTPHKAERHQIFEIHLNKAGRDPKNFDIKALVKHSHEYTGAEIENSIGITMRRTFKEDREFTTEDILWGLTEVTPITKSKGKEVDNLRNWAKESGAKNASIPEGKRGKNNVEAWNVKDTRL